jgi:hypothetical protein
VFPRDMVCLRNICVDTLHKGDTDDNNNNNNNNNLKYNILCIEIQRMWNLKCTIIPVII